MTIAAPGRPRSIASAAGALYSNHRPQDAAFLDELQRLARENENLRLVATMTRMGSSSRSWDGRTGPIDDALLAQIAGELASPVYYVAGPPSLVEAMRLDLNDVGVDDDDIRSEEFYGY